MNENDRRTDERAEHLLPEEHAAGSADPQAQAAEILTESDARTDAPDAIERRTSDDTVEPTDTPE